MSLEVIYEAILRGDAPTTKTEVDKALAEGTPPDKILHEACIPAMDEVGHLFEIGEKFVPEMLIAARAMQAALNILRPQLVDSDVQSAGMVVLGTVAGDLHDIGKNLVGMMMEGAGFDVVDLGTDVSPEQFIKAMREHEPDIIGMSALLTTTMNSMGATIEALTEAGLRDQVKVMIGGAPITQDFAEKIGADGFSADAGSAARLAKQLVNEA